VKDISAKTKLTSKAVSAQLKELEKYHIIEKVKTDTKNYLYRISERFFNIWYLMRLGRKGDERRVRFLVEFLQIWCDEKELIIRAQKHLKALQQGAVHEKQDPYMSEIITQISLKKDIEHDPIQKTGAYLEKYHTSLKKDFFNSDKQKALESFRQAYIKDKTLANTYLYSIILLWNNHIEESYQVTQDFLLDFAFIEKYHSDTSFFLLLLIAKKQLHLALKIFNENPLQLKDRFKPIYYALMYFMQDEFPNEYRKMGEELSQTVQEIIEKVHNLAEQYE